MNEVITTLISIVFGGGVLTAIVAAIKAFSERQKTKAEAAAIGITTPVQAESITIATMTAALNGARAINEDYKTHLGDVQEQLASVVEQLGRVQEQATKDRAELVRVRQESEADYNGTQHEIRALREAFEAAERYVGILLIWIEEKMPGSRPPRRQTVSYDEDRGQPPEDE